MKPTRNFHSTTAKSFLFIFLITVSLLVSCSATNAQVDTLWTKTFGGNDSDIAYSVQQTTDGGYILISSTQSFGAGGSDAWLIKTNASGDTIWTKTFGGTGFDEALSGQQTTDGGYILTGSINKHTNAAVFLIKTDSLGDGIWTKTLGSGYAHSVDQTSDGGYIVVGNKSVDPYSSDILLIKTDSAGDTIWTKTFNGWGAISDHGVSVKQITEDEYVFLGYSSSIYIDSCMLVKIDDIGNTIWIKKFDIGLLQDAATSFQQTTDGGYIIAGWTTSFGEYARVWILKTDTFGDLLWTKVIGEINSDEGAYSIQQTEDGGYIIAGFTKRVSADYCDILLIKTDADGEKVWTKALGGILEERAHSIQLTKDGGYIIAGYTESFGAGDYDIWLIKTTPDISSIERDSDIITVHFSLTQNYPNPFNAMTTISFQISELSFITLKVYDVLGNEVTTLVNGEKLAGTYEVVFDAKGLPSGIYFNRIQAGNFIETKKMVLLR